MTTKEKPKAKEAELPVTHFRGKHGEFAVCGNKPTENEKMTDLEAGVSGCEGCLRFVQAAG